MVVASLLLFAVEITVAANALSNVIGSLEVVAPLNGNLEETMAYRAGPMSIDRVVLAFAGTLVLISLVLSQIHSPYWLWLTAFVGANMLQSAFTGFCPLVKVLKRLGVRPGHAFS